MTTPPPFRERLSWQAQPGRIMDGAVRYMMIRPDALMDAVMRLSVDARGEMLMALFSSVREFGGRSASNYNQTATRPLIEVVAETAPDLGWGLWQVERDGDTVSVTVTDSPFTVVAEPSDVPLCAPITGMLSAVGAIMGAASTVAEETVCAARDGGHVCQFHFKKG